VGWQEQSPDPAPVCALILPGSRVSSGPAAIPAQQFFSTGTSTEAFEISLMFVEMAWASVDEALIISF
jgi:hypothetical protein